MSQNRVDYVMGKVGDKQYANLTTTAERLSQNVEKSRNDNLFSLACEHIQHSELLPDPADVNGINLKQLYSWMGNACAGYPIDIDDGPTKDFLLKCYKVRPWEHCSISICFDRFPSLGQELMDSTDSLDVNDLRNHLDNQDEDVRQVYSWITNSEYNSDYVPRIFGETNRKWIDCDSISNELIGL